MVRIVVDEDSLLALNLELPERVFVRIFIVYAPVEHRPDVTQMYGDAVCCHSIFDIVTFKIFKPFSRDSLEIGFRVKV